MVMLTRCDNGEWSTVSEESVRVVSLLDVNSIRVVGADGTVIHESGLGGVELQLSQRGDSVTVLVMPVA